MAKALKKEDGREASPPDLVRDISLIVFDPDGGQALSQIGIAQVPALQFDLQDALNFGLPVLSLSPCRHLHLEYAPPGLLPPGLDWAFR